MAQIIVHNREDAVVERLKTRVALAEALECRGSAAWSLLTVSSSRLS